MIKLIDKDIVVHPASSKHGAILFFYKGGLYRAPRGNLYKRYDELNGTPNIQSIEETDFVLSCGGKEYPKVYKHKMYPHMIRIYESAQLRAIDFITKICEIQQIIIPKGYVLCDIHEGNIYDTMDGVLWTDWGSIFSLTKPEGRKLPALAGLALTMYLANLYIYRKYPNRKSHTSQRGISLAHNTKSPIQHLGHKNPADVGVWKELKDTVATVKCQPPKSHWADEYTAKINWEDIGKSAGKAPMLLKMIDSLEYDTVTDVACNKGYFTIYASQKAKSSVGLDVDEGCVHKAVAFKKAHKLDNVIFSHKNIKDIYDSPEAYSRYGSDVVIAMAIVHHLKGTMSHEKFSECLVKLSKKYIILEDIGTAGIYEKFLAQMGFMLEQRIKSTPGSRTISLYKKQL